MKADIYWIPVPSQGRLAIMPRPRSGDWLNDEIEACKLDRVNVIVSLLMPAEVQELGLHEEQQVCEQHAIQFISYPIPDMQVPASIASTLTLVTSIATWLAEGRNVAIHCRAGIGRSSVMAGCVLVMQGLTPAQAFEIIGAARGYQVPETDEQEQWVDSFAKQVKG